MSSSNQIHLVPELFPSQLTDRPSVHKLDSYQAVIPRNDLSLQEHTSTRLMRGDGKNTADVRGGHVGYGRYEAFLSLGMTLAMS